MHIEFPLFIFFFYQILDLTITKIKVTNANISFSAYSQIFFQVSSSNANTGCVCMCMHAYLGTHMHLTGTFNPLTPVSLPRSPLVYAFSSLSILDSIVCHYTNALWDTIISPSISPLCLTSLFASQFMNPSMELFCRKITKPQISSR